MIYGKSGAVYYEKTRLFMLGHLNGSFFMSFLSGFFVLSLERTNFSWLAKTFRTSSIANKSEIFIKIS